MELNFILFPAPVPSYTYTSLHGQIIFIPRGVISNFKSDFSELKQETGESTHIPCLFLKCPLGSSKVIIYFHGNAEDIGQGMELMEHLRDSLGIHVICAEYPGYGIYQGYADSTRIVEDALNIYDYLAFECKLGEENILVFGRSIGTGPAVQVAAAKRPAALVLMSAYTSLRAVIKNLAGSILQYALRDRFRNKDLMKLVTSPTFLIHGIKDTLIPYSQSQELLQVCNSAPCYLSLPEEMDHSEFDFLNDLSFPLKDFLGKFDIRIEAVSSELGMIPFPENIFDMPPGFLPVSAPGFFKGLIQKYL